MYTRESGAFFSSFSYAARMERLQTETEPLDMSTSSEYKVAIFKLFLSFETSSGESLCKLKPNTFAERNVEEELQPYNL